MKTPISQAALRFGRIFTAAAGLALLSAASLNAQTAGRVDPTFGRSLGAAGKTSQVVLQPDGKVLVAGIFTQHVGRLEADGRTDPNFILDPTLQFFGPSSPKVYLQPDGKIILDGFKRLQRNGALDSSFHPGAQFGAVFAVALQSDDKLIVAAQFVTVDGQARSKIVRLHPNGDFDTSFDPGTGPNLQYAAKIQLQSDGKIVIAGDFTSVNGVARNGIARLNSDGKLDPDFDPNKNGTVASGLLAIQLDDKILCAGFGAPLVRINYDGSIDNSFKYEVPTTYGYLGANQVALQPGGKIIVGGNSLYRLNSNGSFDPSYGIDQRIQNVTSVALQPDGAAIFLMGFSVYRAKATGMLDLSFVPDPVPGPNGDVHCVTPLADGSFLIGGIFTHFSGIGRNHIAKVLPDGTLDTAFDVGWGPGLNGRVKAIILLSGGRYLVRGNFSSWGDKSAQFLVRLNSDGTLDPTFGPIPSLQGIETATLLPDEKIVLGGSFPSRVARLNSDGSLDSSFDASGSIDWTVTAVTAQPDGKLVIGGYESPVIANARVARLDQAGRLDSTFESQLKWGTQNGIVRQIIILSDGKILIGGYFNGSNVSSRGVFRLQTDGSVDTTFQTSTDRIFNCFSMALQSDGKIIVGGNFAFDFNHQNVARLNENGSTDQSYAVNAAAIAGSYGNEGFTVAAVVLQPNDDLLIGGGFTVVNGKVRNFLARLKPSGIVDNSFNPGIGQPSVAALALQPTDGKVIVGGNFVSAGGAPVTALARLRGDGSLDPVFKSPYTEGETVQALTRRSSDGVVFVASLDPTVTSATLVGDKSYRANRSQAQLSGRRPDAAGRVKNPIRPCNPIDGAFDANFNQGNPAGTNGVTHAISLQGPDLKILLGGAFSELNGETGHLNIGRLNADGTLDTSFTASCNQTVRTLAVQPSDHKSIVGGDFTQVNGLAAAHLARLNLDGSLDDAFQTASGPNGPVTAVRLQTDGKIVIAGAFTVVKGTDRRNLARLNADGSLDTSFVAGVFSRIDGTPVEITAIVQQPHDLKLIVAGLFDTIGSTPRHNIARLNTNGSIDPTFDPATGPDAIVRSLILQPDGKSILGGDFTTVDLAARAATARLLGDPQAITSSRSISGVIQQPLIPYQIAANNNPKTFASDGLPEGLTLNEVSGVISGVPTKTGNYLVFIAAFGEGTATDVLQLTIQDPAPLAPVINSPRSANASQGGQFSYTIKVDNPDPNSPVTYACYGVLPPGLSFNPNTGTISGTPTGAPSRIGDGSTRYRSDSPATVTSYVLIMVASNSHGTMTAYLTINVESATPTPTPTPTATPTATPSPTSTPIPTATATPSATISPTPSPTPTPVKVTTAVNISTRVAVGRDENVLIGGFIVTGVAPKKVIIRAIAPSLTTGGQPLSGRLEDPMLKLHAGDGSVIAENDDWRSSQEEEIQASTIPPPDDRESAIVATLLPGNHTAVLRGKDNSTGIAVVEVYDLDSAATSQLAQISTRGFVQTGDDVMIGGFILVGTESANVVIRAIGPTLTNFGIVGALEDPMLELRNGDGTLAASNDNWMDSQQVEIEGTGLNPNDVRESVILAGLNPGNYTAIVRGTGNTTGVGLVEVYKLP